MSEAELTQKISELITSVVAIDLRTQSIDTRLKAVEERSHGREDQGEPHAQVRQVNPGGEDNEGATGGQANSPQNTFVNVQQEFAAIRDSLSRVRLPSDLKVNDTSVGVQRSDQQRLKVVSRCSRYTETLIKLISSLQADTVTAGDLQDLLTVCVAEVRFLQEEHAMMLVGNNFGDGVEKLYRSLRSNTTPEALETLQAAVLLGGHSNAGRARGQQRGGYYPGNNGRWNRGGYGRGAMNQGRGRVPPNRSQDQQSQQAERDSQ